MTTRHAKIVTRPKALNVRPVDPILLGAILMLMAIGLVMVYSASVHAATIKQGNGAYYLTRSLVYVTLGLITMWVTSRIPYQKIQAAVPILILASVVMMLMIPFFGYTAGRAQRWFNLGFVMFQPTEFAKLALVIYMAHIAHAKRKTLASLTRGYLPPLMVAGVLMVTALMQPDFGSAVIFGVLVVTMLFVAGTRLAYVALTFLIAVPTVLHLILHNTMRWKRLTAFLDPSAYQHDAGFQTINSLAAIANGGIDGIGLGAGQQKVGYIPEAQTDFIVSVIGEELGLIGIALVLILYAIVFIRGLKVARQAPDSFGQALGFGIILLLAIQVFINFGVAYGVLPTKGLTLPLISYGGTSMLMTCIAIGILLHLSRAPDEQRSKLPRNPVENRGAVPLDLAGGTA